MNKTKEIIDLKNRLSKLEDAVFGKDKEEIEPKFKAWEAYKNEDGVIVICSHTDNELRGYGISRNTWYSIFADENEFNQKATPEETEAMLRKACEIWGGEDWENVKIKKCLFSDDEYNDGDCEVTIENDEIWNRNGCIMYQGKWAEKLEEYKDGEKYILTIGIDRYTLARYVESDESFISINGDEFFKDDIKSDVETIEPYTQERLIELAEKF